MQINRWSAATLVAYQFLRRSLVEKCDAPAREIVRGDFHGRAITSEDADAKASHLARRRRQQFVPVLEIDAEHRARQDVRDGTFELDCSFFHVILELSSSAHLYSVSAESRLISTRISSPPRCPK